MEFHSNNRLESHNSNRLEFHSNNRLESHNSNRLEFHSNNRLESHNNSRLEFHSSNSNLLSVRQPSLQPQPLTANSALHVVDKQP